MPSVSYQGIALAMPTGHCQTPPLGAAHHDGFTGEIDFVKHLSFGLIILIFLIGCGGTTSGGGSGCCGVPGINVDVVSPVGPAGIDDNPNLTLGITVKVTNDSSNAGVTWTVAPVVKNGPTGTLSNQQPFSVTYTPPTGVNSSTQVTVTATSVTDPTRSAIIPVAVYSPLAPVTTSSDLAAAYLKTSYTCIQQPIGTAGVTQIPCAVAATGGLAPYTWSLGNATLPLGLQVSPATSQSIEIAGTPTVSGIYLFSLTATDATGNKVTLPLTINVAPAQLKVPTPTVMNVLPGQPYVPIQLQASGGTPPYIWSLATGSAPLPSWVTLSASGVISATPPVNFPVGGTSFAIQVSDSQSPVPAQAVFPSPVPSGGSLITLTTGQNIPSDYQCQGGTSYSLKPNTPYAFEFAGFDKNGPVTLSGSFTADANGNLTGVEDIISSTGAQLAQPLAAGSTVLFDVSNVSSDLATYRGCLTLNTASSTNYFTIAPTTAAPSGSTNIFTDGRIAEFDDTTGTGTRGAGSFRMQDTTVFGTPVAGPFAFRFSGWDASSNHFAMAGTITAQTGALTAVTADVNDGGTYSGPLSGGGTITTPDSTGRGTATLSAGAATYDLVYYVVDATHLIFNSAQAVSNGHPLLTGEAIASAGPFSQATLSNSHIFRFGGVVPGSPDVAVGVLHFDGSAAASGTTYEKSGGTTTTTTVSAQYSVDPTSGRFVFTGTGVPVIGYAVPSSVGVTGYLLGTGASAVSGTMEYQTNSYPPGYQFSPFAGSAYAYGLATEEMLDPQTTVLAGQEFPTPNGILTGGLSYLDSSGLTGLLPLQQFQLFKYTWSADGTGTWGGNAFMVTNQSKFFYIDTSPLNGHPGVIVGQLQHP